MSENDNLLQNTSFDDLIEPISDVQGEFCKNWVVRAKGGKLQTKYEAQKTQIHDVTTISVNITETIGWFRLMQKIDLHQLTFKKMSFNIDCNAEENATPVILDFIAILEVDEKSHASSHTKIFNQTEISATKQSLQRVFELNPLKKNVSYYFAIQTSQPCKLHFSNFSLTEFDPYDNNEAVQKMVQGAIFAAEKKQSAIAPYKNYGFSYYEQLANLNASMSSYAKSDLYIYLKDMIFIALRFEAYDTAIALVRYMLALPTRMNEEQFKVCAPVIIATMQGVGDGKGLKQFIVSNIDMICGNDELFSAYSFMMFNEGVNDRRAISLPSGKTNCYLLNKMINANAIRTNFTYDIMLQNKFSVAGEQSLMLANCYVPTNPAAYLNMLNNYLGRFGVPLITKINLNANNVLTSVEFEPVKPVEKSVKVTVIIAGYNCAATVAYAIKSVLNQSYRNIEVLFCDDGSDDGTLKIAQSYSQDERLKIFRSEGNQGCYNIRNQLIAISTGDFITFHDSDDYAIPTRIATQLEEVLSKQSLMSLGRWLRINPSGEFMFFKDHAALRMCVNSIMFRREIFATIGQYRSVLCGADSEFFEKARALFGDSKITHVKAPLVLGLWSDSSMTKQSGTEALDNGYRAPKRRAYAEIASRQRALGTALYSDAEVDAVNATSGIYRAPTKIVPYTPSEEMEEQNYENNNEKNSPRGIRKWLK
jgi:glycosyltransferase involved in cell wall biosynthesis